LNTDQFPKSLQPLLRFFRVDFAPQSPPAPLRLLIATVVSLVASLLADWLLVKLGTNIYPSTRPFPHFQFGDYAKLTIIGVVIACVGWPLVTRLTSQPRRLFLQAAIAISIVLLAPDAYIWHNDASGNAVFVLVWMHLAIAIITYNALVYLAPAGRGRRPRHART
jgi:H+/Cl- antiporter ClcA